MELKKGQIIWIAITQRKTEITKTTIKSVGSKYITTAYDSRIKFDRDTMREVNGVGYGAYLIMDIDEFNTNRYYQNIVSKLQRFEWKISRDKLDEIAKILSLIEV